MTKNDTKWGERGRGYKKYAYRMLKLQHVWQTEQNGLNSAVHAKQMGYEGVLECVFLL